MSRADLVRLHGDDPIAVATLQPGMAYFDTSWGYVAYRRVHGIDLTLGPPICAPADRGPLVERFLAMSRRPIVAYVREELLAALDPLHVAGMGVDRLADVPGLLADTDPAVRSAVRKAKKAGFVLGPLAGPERLEAITRSYLARSEAKVELSFLNRPASFEEDGLRRRFGLESPAGYVILNPWFRAGRVDGYLLDVVRFEPTRLWGVWYAVVHAIAQVLRDEGVALSLGYCPLHRVRTPAGGSRALGVQLAWMGRTLSGAQYAKRLAEMKSRIPGHEEQRYFASFSRSAARAFAALVAASGVRVRSLVNRDLARLVWR